MLEYNNFTIQAAVNILQSMGEVRTNGLRHWLQYEDERMRIVGFVKPRDLTYETIRIEINLAEKNPPLDPPVFGMGQRNADHNWTLVFFSEADDQYPRFFRPGKWHRYLEAMYRMLVAQLDKNTELDKQPIDDERLFSDIQ